MWVREWETSAKRWSGIYACKQCYLDARAEAKRGGGGRESWGKLSEWQRAGERGPANGAPKRAGD